MRALTRHGPASGLPHEWEWQYAAQGTDGRLYPWGNEWNAAAVPVPDKGRTMRGPDAVDAHPQGASPFGVMDMVGNVWQWTDEFIDEHTRAVSCAAAAITSRRDRSGISRRLQAERTRQVAADGAEQGPFGRTGIPLRAGCAIKSGRECGNRASDSAVYDYSCPSIARSCR